MKVRRKNESLEHYILKRLGVQWLWMNGFRSIAIEVPIASYIHDVAGWGMTKYEKRSGSDPYGVILEAKAVKSDFTRASEQAKQDKLSKIPVAKKQLFIAPTGVIDVKDLPLGWGLLEVANMHEVTLKRKPHLLVPKGCQGTRLGDEISKTNTALLLSALGLL